jgi:Tuberculosis necrotizing toxin
MNFRNPYGYHIYRVLTPFNVTSGPSAAAFEQPGQGVQYYLFTKVSDLLTSKPQVLEEVDPDTLWAHLNID